MNNKLEIIETPDYILAILEYKPISEPCYRFHKFEKTINHPYHSLEHGEKYTNCWLEIIAYQPKHDKAPELDLPLLPEISVEDDVNLKAQYYAVSTKSPNREAHRRGYVEGYKAATKVYSEEDIIKLMYLAWNAGFKKYDVVEAGLEGKETDSEVRWILSKFKSSKTPKWFVAEIETEYKPKQNIKDIPYEDIPKTTTINNKTYLVGTYKYE
jgi:hypothetical protein